MYSFSLVPALPIRQTEEEVQRLGRQYPEWDSDPGRMKTLFSLMDYTSLDGADHPAKIEALCRKAISFGEKGLPWPAAVCIYPPFIALARQVLQGTPIHVATTAAAFPSGQMPLHVKLEEIRYAVGEGADEIDVVISRGTLLAGEYLKIYRELDSMRELCSSCTLKVILETGELQTPENIARAGEIAIEAGADFIKTSTGKISPAATPEAVFIMLHLIREFYRRTGKKVGIKPAGGISEPAQAMAYYRLVNGILGEEWLTLTLFRIGASRLADRIVDTLNTSPL